MHDDDVANEETTLLLEIGKNSESPLVSQSTNWILLLLQLCEPIISSSIYPYINQLVSGLDITGGDERKVGYYAGLIQSLFFVTEAIMVMQWSRLSDRSVVSRSPLWLAVLCGLLNGNIGVMKSAMGELTDRTNRARAFSFMSVIWATGSTLGPLMGGSLSRPHERFPAVFTGQFWIDYPYFYPASPLPVYGFCFHGRPFLPERDTASMHLLRLHNLAKDLLRSVNSSSTHALIPLFLATPIEIGGLGFEPSTIGYTLARMGYATVSSRHYSSLALFGANFIPIYLLFPVMSIVAQRYGVNVTVWLLIALMMSLMSVIDMAYGCIFMYITASPPNEHSLGATNGLAQTTVSLVRTLGPTISTSLFALSAEKNLMGGYAVM
ncbi:major facilitator superfamily domain-containing protein [Infundibulicybe gibba]|nr:major facilitator superfamily domain-containing protein [Infundibulicybe gibba]